jgi:hypothetical protein
MARDITEGRGTFPFTLFSYFGIALLSSILKFPRADGDGFCLIAASNSNLKQLIDAAVLDNPL